MVTALSQRAIAEIRRIFCMSLVEREEAIAIGSSKKKIVKQLFWGASEISMTCLLRRAD